MSINKLSMVDELTKISFENKDFAKKWIKNTALISAGAGTGALISTILNKLPPDKIPMWNQLDSNAKKQVAGALLGAITTASGVIVNEMSEESKRRLNESKNSNRPSPTTRLQRRPSN